MFSFFGTCFVNVQNYHYARQAPSVCFQELSHGLLVHGQEIDNDIHNVLMRFVRYVDKTLHSLIK